MNILIYGPEGSGKSTQGRLLAQKLKIPHLVSGDLVRKAASEDKGLIGKICRDALERGKYVPDEKMFILWKRRLADPDTQRGWVIDGFPRTVRQLEFLKKSLAQQGKKITKVFYLVISEKESIKRLLKRRRKLPNGQCHDTPERIKARLASYKREAAKLLSYFKKMGVLEEIDGEGSIEEIHREIIARL